MLIGNGVDILHEDDFIIVCKKPAGLATQTKQTRAHDLVTILKRYLYMKNPKAGEPYLGIIHRLDQPVSGLLVFAKDSRSAATLSKAMLDHDFGKHYAAILSDKPNNEAGQLVDYMVKSQTENISRVCAASEGGAKKAVLNYQVVNTPSSQELALFPFIELDSSKTSHSYVRIKLETGRHHQIRVQTSHAGYPIIGDSKYGIGPQLGNWKNIALCAYKLNFKHPNTQKSLCFSLI